MQRVFDTLAAFLPTLQKAVFSSPANKGDTALGKITLSRKNGAFFAEERRGDKVFHQALASEEVVPFAREAMERGAFRQINLFSADQESFFLISKKGRITQKTRRISRAPCPADGHDRAKNYMIREGEAVPFLVDLGVMTKDGRVVKSMYDKFRQINRFLELLSDAFDEEPDEEVRVVDFGCGKSYLTFLIYYYFSVLKKRRVVITGYDLKEDVVSFCSDTARRYGYHGLSFECRDVVKNPPAVQKIDFVISLHACDIATDYALQFALSCGARHIFSVPCCQHEIAGQIHPGGDFDLLLKNGLFRERLAALVTDAIRAEVLRQEGYRVDVIEFVDFAHSPKNVMLRCVKTGKGGHDFSALSALQEKYGLDQTLLRLRKDAL